MNNNKFTSEGFYATAKKALLKKYFFYFDCISRTYEYYIIKNIAVARYSTERFLVFSLSGELSSLEIWYGILYYCTTVLYFSVDYQGVLSLDSWNCVLVAFIFIFKITWYRLPIRAYMALTNLNRIMHFFFFSKS